MSLIDVQFFLENSPYKEIPRVLLELAKRQDRESLIDLENFLLTPDKSTMGTSSTSRYVCAACLQRGVNGVELLKKMLLITPSPTYQKNILASLWFGSLGRTLRPIERYPDEDYLDLFKELPIGTIQAAKAAFKDILIESLSDLEVFQIISHVLSFSTPEFYDEPNTLKEFHKEIITTYSESAIRLTKGMIEEFQTLVNDSSLSEETYQTFLSKNPVFIDPLANAVISKQKLGIEHVTDFVLKLHDNSYVLVEIEKPRDRIFTQANDFTADFIHAYGQVLDFQQWVDQSNGYANKHMPSISAPKGLLIIGMRNQLSEENLTKLHRFCVNSKHIDILTFDDLLTRAENLYKNIHKVYF
jgi:hypothetical protein